MLGLRALWFLIGSTALLLGAAGAILPVLPTTPFVVLAAFAYGKSSCRIRKWLADHQLFGSAIRQWEEHGAIQRRHKIAACGVMSLTLVISVAAGAVPVILLVQAACMASAAAFILTRPSSG